MLIDLFTVYDGILAEGQTPLKLQSECTGVLAHFSGTAITSLQRGGFPQRKCILIDICTDIIFTKYKEEIQVITTINEFLRFHSNPSNQHYANYHEIRSHIGRFTDVVPSFIALFSVE